MAEEHPLVQLARKTIEVYVRSGRKLRLDEAPPGIARRAGGRVCDPAPDQQP